MLLYRATSGRPGREDVHTPGVRLATRGPGVSMIVPARWNIIRARPVSALFNHFVIHT